MSLDISMMQSYLQLMRIGDLNAHMALKLIQSATQGQTGTQSAQSAQPVKGEIRVEAQPVQGSGHIDIRV
ncbi:MAG: hypothetical protein V2I36_10070 [Desulfopila sp.]|jgi:hypothetical protein|nr:hypothetical protein [Desulfopila sp.]